MVNRKWQLVSSWWTQSIKDTWDLTSGPQNTGFKRRVKLPGGVKNGLVKVVGESKLPSFFYTKKIVKWFIQQSLGPSLTLQEKCINASSTQLCSDARPQSTPSVGSRWFPQWPWWNTGTSATQPKSPEFPKLLEICLKKHFPGMGVRSLKPRTYQNNHN